MRPTILVLLVGLVPVGCSKGRVPYKERMTRLEARFAAASRAGKTVKGVLVEGNSLFNGTTSPQRRPYGQPYTRGELVAAKVSAERNSTVFVLTRDGTLYYPTPKKGERESESQNSPRIPRILRERQRRAGKKLFTWATLVPLVGREVELLGEVYPGHGGVKGIAIEAIAFEGEYIVGRKKEQ
jgi:hypothetical protein